MVAHSIVGHFLYHPFIFFPLLLFLFLRTEVELKFFFFLAFFFFYFPPGLHRRCRRYVLFSLALLFFLSFLYIFLRFLFHVLFFLKYDIMFGFLLSFYSGIVPSYFLSSFHSIFLPFPLSLVGSLGRKE